MSKATVEIEVPNRCEECLFYRWETHSGRVCAMAEGRYPEREPWQEKPKWCPLDYELAEQGRNTAVRKRNLMTESIKLMDIYGKIGKDGYAMEPLTAEERELLHELSLYLWSR